VTKYGVDIYKKDENSFSFEQEPDDNKDKLYYGAPHG
jgi:hypothetical protein